MKRKIYLWIGIVAVVLAAAFFAYSKWMAPTRVAFVNYQAISLGSIYKANDNSHIKLVEVSTDELDKLKDFDMIFISTTLASPTSTAAARRTIAACSTTSAR